MGIDLNLRLWWDGRDGAGRFLALVDALAAWPPMAPGFQGLTLKDARYNTVWSDAQVTNAEGVRAAFSQQDLSRRAYSTGLTFPVWRIEGKTAKPGSVWLGVDGWDPGWRPERDRRVEGDANLWTQTTSPFMARLGDGEDLRRINAHVEENVERLLELCQHLIRTVGPDRMMVYTDGGMALPINAHLAWFRQPVQVLDDLAWLRELWADGLPGYNLSPLRDPDASQDSMALHEGRSCEQRRQLWRALGACIGAEASLEDVSATLKSGAFELFENGEGVLLLNYPHPLNAFLDRFYLAVLERAAARG